MAYILCILINVILSTALTIGPLKKKKKKLENIVGTIFYPTFQMRSLRNRKIARVITGADIWTQAVWLQSMCA